MLVGEDEIVGEHEEQCTCDPCTCETPEGASPTSSKHGKEEIGEAGESGVVAKSSRDARAYQLDEFNRAKEYFLTASTESGLTVYDHLSEVIRKLLDTRSPPNAVDFIEEISMNVKRYRFGMRKDLLRDIIPIPPALLEDSRMLIDNWRNHAQWSQENAEAQGEERPTFGGFPNLLRLLYYLEQINVGLPREEMFRIALAVRELKVTKPVITRARFWGKIIGLFKSYYVVEAELSGDDAESMWNAPAEEPQPDEQPPSDFETLDVKRTPSTAPKEGDVVVVPGAGATFERAGFSVTDPEILNRYQETSGLPSGGNKMLVPKPVNEFEQEYYGEGANPVQFDNPDAAADLDRWQKYQHELMTGFPVPAKIQPEVEVPPEAKGVGVNRRIFYISTDLHTWTMLPDVTPKQINTARRIRWFLTGNLDSKLITLPAFPGSEGHYLRAQLARITAGAMVSPRGYFRTKKVEREYDSEEEEEEEYISEEEEEEREGNDVVYPMKKYKPPAMMKLLNPSMEVWVHHTNGILRQGRVTWWNPKSGKKEGGDGGEDEDEEDLEDEEEEDGADREFGPPLFTSLGEDKSLDKVTPWSPRASSTVFTEFQVVCARSNLWPGSTALCTSKGKVENIYVGDGLKFYSHTYAPFVPEETAAEYKEGPELQEDTDPTVEFEQAWMKKAQAKEVDDEEEEDDESLEDDETELEEYTEEED